MQQYWGQLRSYVEDTLVQLSVSFTLTPAPPDPPIEPFPPLPSELVLRILLFTLPAPSYAAAKPRARRLKQIALLDKDCARWATLLLRQDVAVSSIDAARWFSMTATTRGPTWAGAVRSLRLGSAEEFVDAAGHREAVDKMWRSRDSGKTMQDLLKTCEAVEDLWLSGISGVEVGHLAAGKNLRRLFITETRIVPSASSAGTDEQAFLLPRLHTLHLKSVIFTGPSLPSFLSPSSLPSLRTLDYLSVHQSLVTPLPPQAAPQGGPLLLGGGGATGLAHMTAALAALAPPSAPASSRTTPSPSTATQPVLTIASQLTSLALGPHATRTLPLSILTSSGLSLLFPSLLSLSLPWSLFPSLLPSDFPSSLLYLRVSSDGRPSLPWNVDARTLQGVSDEDLRAEVARTRSNEVQEMEARGLEVFQHLFPSSTDKTCVRTLTLPGTESGLEAASKEVGQQRLFCRSAGASMRQGETGGLWVEVEREDGDELKDGVWHIGAERWRERLGREVENAMFAP
ncbi:hypothetical protein JCM11641_006718 [Rhodosporidiobolus odoratus]